MVPATRGVEYKGHMFQNKYVYIHTWDLQENMFAKANFHHFMHKYKLKNIRETGFSYILIFFTLNLQRFA